MASYRVEVVVSGTYIVTVEAADKVAAYNRASELINNARSVNVPDADGYIDSLQAEEMIEATNMDED